MPPPMQTWPESSCLQHKASRVPTDAVLLVEDARQKGLLSLVPDDVIAVVNDATGRCRRLGTHGYRLQIGIPMVMG